MRPVCGIDAAVARRPLIELPDERLRRPSREVIAFDDALASLATDLAETMSENRGAGLAAVQVGVPLRMFVVDQRRAAGKSGPPRFFVNPVLEWASEETVAEREGCLSVFSMPVVVRRPKQIRIAAQTLEGKPTKVEAEGFHARVLLHEYDHLAGITLYERAAPAKRELLDARLAQKK